MNRENKRKQYEKGYYKVHACNETFVCKNCGRTVVPEGAGSDHRNHCPNCLYSLHVDNAPGDRKADCGGHMEPISVCVRKNGEWAIIHRCKICGTLHSNRVAADDNPTKLISIAMRPIGHPPFPIERIEEMTEMMGEIVNKETDMCYSEKNKVSDLKKIPGIGANMEKHLQNIGIHCIADLKGKDPEELYHLDCLKKGFQDDRCVLYVFRCAVYFAEHEHHEPEKLKWWYWKDKEYPEKE